MRIWTAGGGLVAVALVMGLLARPGAGSGATRPAGSAPAQPTSLPTSGLRGQVVKLVGEFLPGVESDRGDTVALAVPVHIFRGRVKPIEKPDPAHPALVRIVHPGPDGRFALALPPGEYTVVAEINGRLYLNNWLEDGSWATVTARPGRWTDFTIEDVQDVTF